MSDLMMLTVSEKRALEDRFVDLWERKVSKEESQKVKNEVFRRYSEHHRHYHTLGHISDCLKALGRAPSSIRDIAELALWFHDSVYEIDEKSGLPSRSNESDSAAFFLQCTKGECNPTFAGHVCELIMETNHRDVPVGHSLAQLVVDADLSSLGADWDVFVRNNRNIRREMPRISDEDFSKGQAAFLKDKFLDRHRIYTSGYYPHLESRARSNIERFVREGMTYPKYPL